MSDLHPLHDQTPAAPRLGGSVLDQIRAERAAAAQRKTVDLDVPTYSTLVARYRLLDPLVEGKRIGDNVKRNFSSDQDRLHYAMVDGLIEACEGLYVRQPDGTLAPAIGSDGEILRYDSRLADELGLKVTSAREVLDGLFNGNRVAIASHAAQHAEWMANPTGAPSLGET